MIVAPCDIIRDLIVCHKKSTTVRFRHAIEARLRIAGIGKGKFVILYKSVGPCVIMDKRNYTQ
jgi:hypothetical protein